MSSPSGATGPTGRQSKSGNTSLSAAGPQLKISTYKYGPFTDVDNAFIDPGDAINTNDFPEYDPEDEIDYPDNELEDEYSDNEPEDDKSDNQLEDEYSNNEPEDEYSDNGLEEEYSENELEEEYSDYEPEDDRLDYELEGWQPAVPRKASSVLRENYEQELQLVEATEAHVEELQQRVEMMIEEKRQASEDSHLLMEQISQLEIDLESHRMASGLGAANEAIQAQNAELLERIQFLERELQASKREKKAVSHKVDTSSKSAPASANLQKQYFEDLKGENLRIVKKLEERDAKAEAYAGLQRTIDGLTRDKLRLDSRLHSVLRRSQHDRAYEVQNIVPRSETDTDLAQDLADARNEIELLRKTIEELKSVNEQQERRIEEDTDAEAQVLDGSDPMGSSIIEDSAQPQEDLGDFGTLSTEADGPEGLDAEPSTSEIDDPKTKESQLEAQYETLRLQYQELQDKNRGFQEQDTRWRKLFRNFMQRATDLQRKDASKHQIKKGFKDLHKIVKEGELYGL
ncbi:MAG: hypothetical protein Q9161_003111 [Pseudevernia consocians]